MSRESSYSAASTACLQVSEAASELESAINSLSSYIGTVEFYWKGEAGSAMNAGLTAWIEKAQKLKGRMATLSESMKTSRNYDYGLWPEEES